MKQRKPSNDPHKLVAAPAFVVEEGERAINAKTLSVMYGCASVHDLVRQLERRMLAYHVINGSVIVHDLAVQILNQCDEARIRTLALERIKQVAIDHILTKPEVGMRMWSEKEQLKQQHDSVDKLLEAMGG